jgi:D-amino-acid oxidase
LDTRLASADTEVLASFAGLRPSREGGNRIERTEVSVNGSKKILVHNYGAGGTGFQAGYGMALDAVKTVEEELQEIRQAASKARL